MSSVCVSEHDKSQKIIVTPMEPTGLSGLWHSRLRAYRGTSIDSTGKRDSALAKNTTPKRLTSLLAKDTPTSGSSAAGLTPSAARVRSSSVRRTDSEPPRVAAASRSSSRSTSVGPAKDVRRQFDPLSKNLFKETLLQELEPHDPVPAITLVLDLDETLVSNRNSNLPCAIIRPYCLHVLNALRHMKNLEIVLWTASTKETASSVVDQLHESGLVFDDTIFRNKLWFTEPVHSKDLRLLGRDMNRVVLVDNSANCCKLNPLNAILIEDFHGFRHEEDAALINVYYMVEALIKFSEEGISVQEGLQKLAIEGHLCRTITYPMPEMWRNLPLSEIPPLKVPPHGKFVRANTAPPSRSIMKYWSY